MSTRALLKVLLHGCAMAIAGGVFMEGCARSIPKTAGGSVGAPKVGWVVMMGDRDNPDRDFVCYSEAPGDCVMPASRPDGQVFADVLSTIIRPRRRPVGGTVQIGFFGSPLELKPNFTVKPDASSAARASRHCLHKLCLSDDDRGRRDPDPLGAARQIREQVRSSCGEEGPGRAGFSPRRRTAQPKDCATSESQHAGRAESARHDR
jgi:hypothetical protein